MARREYRTKQKAALTRLLVDSRARALSAEEIFDTLRLGGETVGRTTVYRQLEQLGEAGFVRRTQTSESAVYQYVENAHACANHLHCRCANCGKLYHVTCVCLETLAKHLLEEHHFMLDAGQSVLMGQCEECRKEAAYGAVDTQECDAGL